MKNYKPHPANLPFWSTRVDFESSKYVFLLNIEYKGLNGKITKRKKYCK